MDRKVRDLLLMALSAANTDTRRAPLYGAAVESKNLILNQGGPGEKAWYLMMR
jgi:hypothetical protein